MQTAQYTVTSSWSVIMIKIRPLCLVYWTVEWTPTIPLVHDSSVSKMLQYYMQLKISLHRNFKTSFKINQWALIPCSLELFSLVTARSKTEISELWMISIAPLQYSWAIFSHKNVQLLKIVYEQCTKVNVHIFLLAILKYATVVRLWNLTLIYFCLLKYNFKSVCVVLALWVAHQFSYSSCFSFSCFVIGCSK